LSRVNWIELVSDPLNIDHPTILNMSKNEKSVPLRFRVISQTGDPYGPAEKHLVLTVRFLVTQSLFLRVFKISSRLTVSIYPDIHSLVNVARRTDRHRYLTRVYNPNTWAKTRREI